MITYSAAQITPMRIFCIYAYVNTRTYARISRVYVSLLCIPISFFIWGIVG